MRLLLKGIIIIHLVTAGDILGQSTEASQELKTQGPAKTSSDNKTASTQITEDKQKLDSLIRKQKEILETLKNQPK